MGLVGFPYHTLGAADLVALVVLVVIPARDKWPKNRIVSARASRRTNPR